jgi:transcriptional regulator with XRE-family HTH domain
LTEIHVVIGEKIRDLRTSFGGRGISQAELARRIHTTANTVSRWETGLYKPSITDLEALIHFFGVSISQIFPDPKPPSQLSALLSAVEGLKGADVEEVILYARIRRAMKELSNR